jgi:hypothetical protein
MPEANGTEVLQNYHNVMDLEDPGSSTANGTQVDDKIGYYGTANQLWFLHPVGSPTQTVPTINWPTPGAITYGTALSSTQLDATANVPGTFSYACTEVPIKSAAGLVLPVGNHYIGYLHAK